MRVFRHLFAPSAKRLFPEPVLERITAAIADSELRHTGEICFAVEPALAPAAVLAGREPREAAHEAFARLRVWDTHANNGVLLYLLLADHRIEIVADRGFNDRVAPEQWREVCTLVEERLRAGDAQAAVLRGIEALSVLLAEHFPRTHGAVDADELPNRPRIL